MNTRSQNKYVESIVDGLHGFRERMRLNREEGQAIEDEMKDWERQTRRQARERKEWKEMKAKVERLEKRKAKDQEKIKELERKLQLAREAQNPQVHQISSQATGLV